MAQYEEGQLVLIQYQQELHLIYGIKSLCQEHCFSLV